MRTMSARQAMAVAVGVIALACLVAGFVAAVATTHAQQSEVQIDLLYTQDESTGLCFRQGLYTPPGLRPSTLSQWPIFTYVPCTPQALAVIARGGK